MKESVVGILQRKPPLTAREDGSLKKMSEQNEQNLLFSHPPKKTAHDQTFARFDSF
jgi:hypothetical protein